MSRGFAFGSLFGVLILFLGQLVVAITRAVITAGLTWEGVGGLGLGVGWVVGMVTLVIADAVTITIAAPIRIPLMAVHRPSKILSPKLQLVHTRGVAPSLPIFTDAPAIGFAVFARLSTNPSVPILRSPVTSNML